MVHFGDLPLELYRSIDGYLGKKDRFQCKQVCRQWYGIFDGLQAKATTIGTPAEYWSSVQKYSSKYIWRATSLVIENTPIDLAMDLVARSSISLASLSLKIPNHKATELACSGNYPSSSAYTSDGIRYKLHITRMLRAYGHSLSSLVLSYPTSRMNVNVDALITALPSCLNILVLHRIDIPLSVLDLEHLYSSCGRLAKLSLHGIWFQKANRPDVHHSTSTSTLTSTSGGQSSITSLELAFGKVDSLRQIMEFMTVVHPERHLNLQHVTMDLGYFITKTPLISIRQWGCVDDCPQQAYVTFAKHCQQLTSLSFNRVPLRGLLDALYHLNDGQYHGLVQLLINKSFFTNKWFPQKFKYVIGEVVKSVSVVGKINRRDMATLRDLLVHCKHLQQLQLYGEQKHTGETHSLEKVLHWEPLNFRDVGFDTASMKFQRLLEHFPIGQVFFAGPPRVKTGWEWLLDSLSNSLTSLTLRQLPIFIRNNELYLSTRLQQLTLQKMDISEPYLKILFFLEALVDLHLDQCHITWKNRHLKLNLMASKNLERLEISQLTVKGKEKDGILPGSLSIIHLFQVNRGNRIHVEQKFEKEDSNANKGELRVACESLQVLVVDGKRLLG